MKIREKFEDLWLNKVSLLNSINVGHNSYLQIFSVGSNLLFPEHSITVATNLLDKS